MCIYTLQVYFCSRLYLLISVNCSIVSHNEYLQLENLSLSLAGSFVGSGTNASPTAWIGFAFLKQNDTDDKSIK